jgi:acyl carrier protein
MTEQEFAKAFTDALNRNELALSPESRFKEMAGWDSLCVLLTIAFADETYGKQLSGRQIAAARTVLDLWKLLETPDV